MFREEAKMDEEKKKNQNNCELTKFLYPAFVLLGSYPSLRTRSTIARRNLSKRPAKIVGHGSMRPDWLALKRASTSAALK